MCMHMHISFIPAHAHLIMTCARASHFGLRMRISLWHAHAHALWPAHAHLILACACASHFGLRRRISFWPEHVHLILSLSMRISFCLEYSNIILGLCVRSSFCLSHVHIILLFAFTSRFQVAGKFLEPLLEHFTGRAWKVAYFLGNSLF